MKIPNLLCSDADGRIVDLPAYEMAGRSARLTSRIVGSELIEMPPGSQLYFMPGRKAVGFDRRSGRSVVLDDAFAVFAFVPPSYTHFRLAAYESTLSAPRLPLFSVTAVGWLNGKYYVPACRTDRDSKQLPTSFDRKLVEEKVRDMTARFPANRLLRHHGAVCALEYGCPNAGNLFLNRWEAPVAVAGACNANCVGCISFQPKDSVASPQQRLNFIPTVDEIVQLAVPHLETAERAIVSFGQGCEGEPLLRADLIEEAVKRIRRTTSRGILHINTNGSRPDAMERLFDAGMDSMRVSLNSAQPELYRRYYRPNNYTFDDVQESLRVARRKKKFSSVNYFVFPGMTDSVDEVSAFERLISRTSINMIQWRNFNIDPDWYLENIGTDYSSEAIGIKTLMARLKKKFPRVMSGYVNKDQRVIAKALLVQA